jgi:hypothetical protein
MDKAIQKIMQNPPYTSFKKTHPGTYTYTHTYMSPQLVMNIFSP